MKSRLRQFYRRALDPAPAATEQPLIDKVAKFAACEVIEGDYLEFGVYRGGSFISAYQALERQFRRRIASSTGGDGEARGRDRRRAAWEGMRFFAFDSFEGLPALTEEDRGTDDFEAGQYACSEPEFREILAEADVPLERVRTVPGWFEETCVASTKQKHDLRKAAVVWIDADLYSSTKVALDFVTDLLQDGTVLVFDDWFSSRGSPYAGEQRAFREWSERLTDRFTFAEYQRESWKRMSFIASAVPTDFPRAGRG